AAVAVAVRHFPRPVGEWLVWGGGRGKPGPMAARGARGGGARAAGAARGWRLAAPVRPVEAVGWDGDALEAQAFAYLAVRSILGLPLSMPSTTGVVRPTSGGRRFRTFPATVP